ncbi:transposase [Kitasatospora cinereorecta]|uniref:Transposase n=1 Tax=Kitasatospora cinereorecta TaxID=285560 RepID=A0ABW0VLC5_9ACTN
MGLIEPVFIAWRARRVGPGTAARVHDLREIVNAILYVNRTGIWEYLPHDFPLYDHSAKWESDGTTQQVHDPLRDRTRRAHGRAVQTVRGCPGRPEHRRNRSAGGRAAVVDPA